MYQRQQICNIGRNKGIEYGLRRFAYTAILKTSFHSTFLSQTFLFESLLFYFKLKTV